MIPLFQRHNKPTWARSLALVLKARYFFLSYEVEISLRLSKEFQRSSHARVIFANIEEIAAYKMTGSEVKRMEEITSGLTRTVLADDTDRHATLLLLHWSSCPIMFRLSTLYCNVLPYLLLQLWDFSLFSFSPCFNYLADFRLPNYVVASILPFLSLYFSYLLFFLFSKTLIVAIVSLCLLLNLPAFFSWSSLAS